MSRTAVVTVGAKRTREYALSCLSLFNRGVDEVHLVGIGDSISKAAEVARVVAAEFGLEPASADVGPLRKGDAVMTRSTFRLRFSAPPPSPLKSTAIAPRPANFASFTSYHLLIDHLLTEEGSLTLGIEGYPRLLRITPTESGFQCSPDESVTNSFAQQRNQEDWKKSEEMMASVTEAFYRAGFVVSHRWEQIAAKLGQFDDVVIGLDTNILFNCVITQQLLDALTLTCPPGTAPNWILLIVPNTVMHEIEQAANSRNDRGQLSKVGRMGYRALEEILELDQSKDIRGVSLLIVGETDPVLDARVELRGLREDFKRLNGSTAGPQGRLSPKMSVGDTIIRDQFKCFLRQLNFHKGTFFLTADKSNSALGQAEGLHSIYCPPAYWRNILQTSSPLLPPEVDYGSERLPMNVPLGKLIYEMAVQFGSIFISANGDSVRLDCDTRGDSLEQWMSRGLRIAHQDLTKLVARYQQTARIPLGVAEAFCESETRSSFF
jgi:DNA-binding protein